MHFAYHAGLDIELERSSIVAGGDVRECHVERRGLHDVHEVMVPTDHGTRDQRIDARAGEIAARSGHCTEIARIDEVIEIEERELLRTSRDHQQGHKYREQDAAHGVSFTSRMSILPGLFAILSSAIRFAFPESA